MLDQLFFNVEVLRFTACLDQVHLEGLKKIGGFFERSGAEIFAEDRD